MKTNDTALILIGYQNDYFSDDGILKGVLNGKPTPSEVMTNTLMMLNKLKDTDLTIMTTPIVFTPDYAEIPEAAGILKTIKEVKAFQKGKPGSDISSEIIDFKKRIQRVDGKRGLNAFYGTNLYQQLANKGIKNVVFAGVVTSVCIDSSARYAYEKGLQVSVLSNCTAGRTTTEQDFYCDKIFPIYAKVMTALEFIEEVECRS